MAVHIAHTPEVVCGSDSLDSRNSRDALLVRVWQADEATDAVAGD